MKDFLDKELALEDTVIFIAPNYRHLVKGTISAFTAQKVRVIYSNTSFFGPPGHPMELLQDPFQLVKITS